MRRGLRALVVLGAMLALVGVGGAAGAPSLNVVVSQVYGGGGNPARRSGTTSSSCSTRQRGAVALAGWSVQYASATGTGNFPNSVTPLPGRSGRAVPLVRRRAAGPPVCPPHAGRDRDRST